MYVWFPVFLSRWSKMIGYDNLICNVVWCYGTCLQASLLSFFFLLKSFISFSSMATFAQCTNQDSNCVYAGTNLWHKIWYQYMHHDDMVCMLWEVWSLMCTSNVAGNTQMASLDRQVTQNGLGVINAIARGIYNGVVEVTVLGDDEWRCSWCRYQDDGDSSLSSRNTLGNGKTANSKSQTSNVKMVVAESGGGLHLAMRKWNDWLYTCQSWSCRP